MSEVASEADGACRCGAGEGCSADGGAAQELVVVWQRLLAEGETCPRCGTTQQAVRAAVDALTRALEPLGIRTRLEERALDQATFEGSPGESSRIWIAGRPLEDWLGASAGASQCCSVCGNNDCRTLEVDGSTFEAVPERLIVKAGLAAASSLVKA